MPSARPATPLAAPVAKASCPPGLTGKLTATGPHPHEEGTPTRRAPWLGEREDAPSVAIYVPQLGDPEAVPGPAAVTGRPFLWAEPGFCKTYLSPKRGCDRFRELGKEHGVRRTNPTAEDPAAQMPPLMSRARPRIVFNAPLSSLLIGGLCCYPVGASGHSVTCWAFAPRPALCTRTEQTLFLMAVIFFQLGTPPFS